MDLAIVDGSVDVTIDTWASRDGTEVSHRRLDRARDHSAGQHVVDRTRVCLIVARAGGRVT